MKINVPTKHLFCIFSPKKCDYMIASFPSYKLAEYELSRLQTDEFFSDALVCGPITAKVFDNPADDTLALYQHEDEFFPLKEFISHFKEVYLDGDN